LDMQKQMEASLRAGVEIESPISVAVDLERLRRSENPEERSLGEIIEAITELRVNVVNIQNTLAEPASILPPRYLRDIFAEFMEIRRHRSSERQIVEMRHTLVSLMDSIRSAGPSTPETEQKLMLALRHFEDIMHRSLIREDEEAGFWAARKSVGSEKHTEIQTK
jgi:hypothetical protein